MKIKKVLNNNFVLVEGNGDRIVSGTGVGYGKRKGDEIEENKIKKVFYFPGNGSQKLIDLISDVPQDVIGITENFIEKYSQDTGRDINDGFYISLIDHINSAINRYRKGLTITNSLLWNIKKYYRDEYNYAKNLVNEINNRFDVDLPDDEVGFVALHLVSVSLTENNNTYKITKIIKEVVSIITKFLNIEFDEDSLTYYRLINHLKYFAERLINDNQLVDKKTSILSNEIFNSIPRVRECTERICNYIKFEYGKDITNEEKFYLNIYISKAVSDNFY